MHTQVHQAVDDRHKLMHRASDQFPWPACKQRWVANCRNAGDWCSCTFDWCISFSPEFCYPSVGQLQASTNCDVFPLGRHTVVRPTFLQTLHQYWIHQKGEWPKFEVHFALDCILVMWSHPIVPWHILRPACLMWFKKRKSTPSNLTGVTLISAYLWPSYGLINDLSVTLVTN